VLAVLKRLFTLGLDGADVQNVVLVVPKFVLKRVTRLASKAASPAGVPRPPAAFAALRAVFRYSLIVAQPSFQKVRLKAPEETWSPNHWWKTSWWNVPTDGVEEAPFPKVIFVCISSAKPTLGSATMTPLVENGNGPAKRVWNCVMSSCVSRTALIAVFRVGVRPLAIAW
jgi:hypothetical protein